jgi:hypothetical protein
MGIRQRELDRLIKYAQGLDLKVSFISKNVEHAADWVIDGSEIRIYTRKNKSITDTILSLIHELGHHLWFIHKKERQSDLKFEEAIDRENLSIEHSNKETPKHLRKKIYLVEKEGIQYWDVIVKDTNIKIAKWRIELQAEFDIWQYEYYYRYGSFPTRTLCRNKWKKLKKKHLGAK